MAYEDKSGDKKVGVSICGGHTEVHGDVIGGNKYIYEARAPVIAALHQLPAPPDDFIGREEELKELQASIATGTGTILCLTGQGGVGKTALALKLAAEIKAQFPDAQIYLNLLGVSDKPLTPCEAMAYLIRSFEPGADLPDKEQELAGIYRSILDGKRALMLMDNAKDAAQIKPLLPPRGCCLLITSRLRFNLPLIHSRKLDTLLPAQAENLLLNIAPRIGDEAHPIAKLCGNLPQALRLAGTLLANRVDLAPSEYARRLADEKGRLEALDVGSEQDQGVGASISLSYSLLGSEMQELWRKLAVFLETFDVAAAGAVWSVDADAATQEVLSRLLQYSMLEWNEETSRYRLHDLMGDFARQKLTADEWHEAALQHSLHYLRVLDRANQLYLKGGESSLHGLALFDSERKNIEAGQAWAADHAGEDRADLLCNRYPGVGWYCLSLRQHPRDCIRWSEAGLAAAGRLKDRESERAHLGNIGAAYDSLGEYRRAIEYHERSLQIARELRDRQGEGLALGAMGDTSSSLGDYRRAIECYQQSLQIARDFGDRRHEGNCLGDLGHAHALLGEYRPAIEYHEQQLRIAHELGDPRGEGSALSGLGIAYDSLGKTDHAIDYFSQHLQIARKLGDRRGEATALGHLGVAYLSKSEYRRAIECHEQRLQIAREIGDPCGEANALTGLGVACCYLGETRRAITYYEQCLGITHEIGDTHGEGYALWNMGGALDEIGEHEKAVEHVQRALIIFERTEDPKAEEVRRQLERWRERP